MKTIFYNTLTNEASTPRSWNTASGYYEVNGNRPTLPDNIIELELIDTVRPEVLDTQYLTNEYQVVDGTYTRVWTVHEKTPQQIEREAAERDWLYPDYAIRIEAVKALAEAYPGLYAHFALNKFPIEDKPGTTDTVHIYCNTILKHHGTLLQQEESSISVQQRPLILTE